MVLEESSWLQHSSLALGDDASAPPEPVATSILDGLSLEESEKRLLIRALEKTGGNQTQAARLLQITRDTLRYKMKKFNVGAPSS